MAASPEFVPLLLYGLAFLSEAVGLGLVVGDIVRAGRVLRRWNDRGTVGTTDGRGKGGDLPIGELLGNAGRRWAGIGLLAAGILLGTVAGVLSLSTSY